MIDPEERQRNAIQAVFSVCADDQTVQTATEASLQVPGALFAGEFHDYITPDRRPQFSSFLKGAPSCVALIDFDKDPVLALRTSERLQEIFLKRISIVAVGSGMDANFLVRTMRSGCREYLTKPIDQGELAAALMRFREIMAPDPATQRGAGRVIVFFGAKGGVGTTTLAVHLASHLVRQRGKRTLLIDHKRQLGHVALYLGLKDTLYHFDELLLNSDRLDAELLNGFVIRHLSGLEVIASPESAQSNHKTRRDELDRVINFLRREYDYVLFDSALAYQDTSPWLLDQGDEIYLISTPDVASLRDLARLVESMHLNEPGKLRLVVNRSTADDSITGDQIEKAVRFPIAVSIPNNYFELLAAINAGEPIAPQRRSEFNTKLAQWSNQIANGGVGSTPAAASKKKSFLSWK